MKKLIFITALFCAAVFSSCTKINDELDALDERLDQLEKEVIPSIDEQIVAINTTLGNLDAMDKELKGYIDNLTTTASSLQEQINAANKKIDEVKTALQGEISTAKSEVLAQLEAVKTELEGELSQINATIATLQAKDAELDKKIDDLRSYVEEELANTKDWASATFATLEQYNALVEEIATIKSQIQALNESISALDTRLTTKINEDIVAATTSLNAELQKQVKEITDAYTAAVQTAKEDITAAYTTAIQTAIDALDSSMKAWVGELLSNYYTIAEVDAKVAAVKQEFNNKLDAQKSYLENLISELSASLSKNIAYNKTLIDALRADVTKLQSDAATNANNIAQNATKISQNAQQILNNAKAITANSSDIAANEKLIEANKTLIESNSKLIAENKDAIASLKSSVETAIAKNAEDVAANAESIAKNAELISKNATAINNNSEAISQNAADIATLQSDLAKAKTEITEAYKKAIETAITTLDGELRGEVAAQVATINTRIDAEIEAVNKSIDALTARVATLEGEVDAIQQQIADLLQDIANMKTDISKLLARIQSLSYIPTYDDGKAVVKYNGSTSRVTLDFEVSPKDAVAELATVWQEALSVKAVYTQTRAVSFIDMPIVEFEADVENGVISVTASGDNLSAEFFAGTQSASARLSISDGNNSVTSEYVYMTAKAVNSKDLGTVIDLSLNGTANCYIVSEKGDYKFDATTIGNGQNGIIADAGFHTSSASITPENVSLLWDENSIVNDLYLDDGKVYFTASANKGNALIAVTDNSDNIIWSWHIWATEQPNDYPSYDGYSTLDRNIGAISANCEDGEATYGLYFQWGRKDPLRNPSTVIDTNNVTGNITYTIEHPTQLVGGNFYNWQYSNKSEYLWGYEYNTKTIYDPCPIGYKVSFPVTSSSAYIYDSSRSGGRWDGKLWYPFAGRLAYESGDQGENDARGIEGFYYVNTYSNVSKNDTYDQYFSASIVLIDNLQFKGFAESVRCIKE